LRVIDYAATKVAEIGFDLKLIDDNELLFLKNTAHQFSQIDRTLSFNIGPNATPLTKLPTGVEKRSLEEICNEAARDLISLNDNLSVYWSGGIDSTLVLISLLKNNIDINKLTVVLSSFSIAEYPDFYNEFIRDKLKVRKVGASIFSHMNPEEIIVTGEHGDQIFGSDNIFLYEDLNRFKDVYTDSWEDGIILRTGVKKSVEYIEPLIRNAPFKIKNAFDLYWWYNITCKWQHVQLRMSSHYTKEQMPLYFKNVKHFYNTDAFQRWSLNEDNHRNLKCRDTITSYKFEAKRIIREFTKDTAYEQNKLKLGSLPTHVGKPYLVLLEDYTRILCDADKYRHNFSAEKFREENGFEFKDLFNRDSK
jgi:hypothetical protein